MTFASKITKHLLLPAYKQIQGQPLFAELDCLSKLQWLPYAELQNRQWQKLQALLEYTYENVPYYRQMFLEQGLKPQDIETPEDFRKLPYLTKEIIREYKDGLKAPGEKLYKDSTSGSTGEPLWFFVTFDEIVKRQVSFFLGMNWAGLDIGERYAKLWGATLGNSSSKNSERFDRLKQRMLGCKFFSVYDLSQDALPDYVRRLKAHKPKVLESYPSPLRVIGQYLENHLTDELQLEAIVTSSETLYDHDRKFLEMVFDCPVFNRYVTIEFGSIAHECDQHQGLHIYTEHAYVECLKNNRPALPGEKGELVITSLSNYGMPFIRYRIGDYGEMSEKLCDCGRGFPLLKSVDGRVFDVVVTPRGQFISGTYWTILFRTVDGIRQFQLVQDEIDRLNVKLVTEPVFQMVSLSDLEKRIRERCGAAMHIQFELVDDIPLTKAGKRKFIISKVPMTFGNQ